MVGWYVNAGRNGPHHRIAKMPNASHGMKSNPGLFTGDDFLLCQHSPVRGCLCPMIEPVNTPGFDFMPCDAFGILAIRWCGPLRPAFTYHPTIEHDHKRKGRFVLGCSCRCGHHLLVYLQADALHLTMDQVITDRSTPAASQQCGFLVGTGLGRGVTEPLL